MSTAPAEVKSEKKGCKKGCRRILLIILLWGIGAVLAVGALMSLNSGVQETVREVRQELTPHGELSILNADGTEFDSWEINSQLENLFSLVTHPMGAVIAINGFEVRFAQRQTACVSSNLLPSGEERGEVRGNQRCFTVADAQ